MRAGLSILVELWFWLLVNSVSLVFNADVLPSVRLLSTSGSVECTVYAAAMLFADAFSFVCCDAGSNAFLRLPANLLLDPPVHCFLVATKGKVKGSTKIGSSYLFLIWYLVFPFR